MRLNRLDLNQLQVLDALLTEQSASRVAERMGLTQPAISAALRRLRDYFGDDLFTTEGRRMVPTPFAESLSEPVRRMLVQAELVSRMRPKTDVADVTRTVRIGLSDYVTSVLVAPVLNAARLEAPKLRFDLFSVLDSRTRYQEGLDRGDVDLQIFPEFYAVSDHPKVEVIRDPYVCIADAANERFAQGFDAAAFSEAGHVVLSRRPSITPAFDEMHLDRLGVPRRVEIASPSFLMFPQMIVGTERVASVPSRLAEYFLRYWPLRIAPCPVDLPPMVQVMQWRQASERDLAISWIRDRILQAAIAPPVRP